MLLVREKFNFMQRAYEQDVLYVFVTWRRAIPLTKVLEILAYQANAVYFCEIYVMSTVSRTKYIAW